MKNVNVQLTKEDLVDIVQNKERVEETVGKEFSSSFVFVRVTLGHR